MTRFPIWRSSRYHEESIFICASRNNYLFDSCWQKNKDICEYVILMKDTTEKCRDGRRVDGDSLITDLKKNCWKCSFSPNPYSSKKNTETGELISWVPRETITKEIVEVQRTQREWQFQVTLEMQETRSWNCFWEVLRWRITWRNDHGYAWYSTGKK